MKNYIDRPVQGFALAPFCHLELPWTIVLANGKHCAATFVFRMNSLRRCCCKPTIHCNKSHDPVGLTEKLCLCFELRLALQNLANLIV